MVNNSALFPAFFSQKERTIFRALSGSRGPWTSPSANDLKDLLIFFTHWKKQILRIFRGLGFNYIIAVRYSWRGALLGICQLSPTRCRFSIKHMFVWNIQIFILSAQQLCAAACCCFVTHFCPSVFFPFFLLLLTHCTPPQHSQYSRFVNWR